MEYAKMKLVKYIVTDPCYILDDDTWNECCKVFDTYKNDEFMYQRFDEAVSKALTKLTGHQSYACDTGFGDWCNKIYGLSVIKHDFCADAGMVCVCRLNHKVLDNLYKNNGEENALSGAAIFEMSEDIDIEFDVSNKDWTVVTIKDKQTGNVVKSMDYEDNFYNEEDEEY
jgi:hypothetical protein